MPIITLMTDFGTKDTYVGVMKGVILSICPAVRIIDLTHEIPAQNVAVGAWQLSNTYSYFPPGTIHLIVIDPGVGSKRRAVISQVNNHTFVYPDNGLLSLVDQRTPLEKSVVLKNDNYFLPNISQTFHGRDIFAPVAAHLAKGVLINKFGPPINNLCKINFSNTKIDSSQIEGQIIWIDHFGNAITNISQQLIDQTLPDSELKICFSYQQIFKVCAAYNQVAIGKILAIIGSSGYLEISVNQDSAHELYDLSIGDLVTVSAL